MPHLIKLCFFLIGTGSAYFTIPGMQANAISNIAITFAGVSGTLLGFIIAALSIITALSDRQLIRNMHKTGHLGQLVNELTFTACAYLFVLSCSLTLLFVTGKTLTYLTILDTGVMALGLWLLISSGKKFYLVISASNS